MSQGISRISVVSDDALKRMSVRARFKEDEAEKRTAALAKADPRPGLVCATAALVGFGALMIFSVSSAGNTPMQMGMALRHVIYALVGTAGLLIARRTDYHLLGRLKWVMLAVAVAALGAVLVPSIGAQINGARRWFSLGPVTVQPSEFAKIALIVFMADFLARSRDRSSELLRGFLPAMAVIVLVCMLIQMEPDFGNAVLIGMVGVSMLTVAGIKLVYILALAGISLPALYFAIIRVPYRLQRLTAFLDPWADPRGVGYHTVQSLIAVGSGGFFGIGLGRSAQKLHYLPSAYSDFLFAIVAEEMGHLGCLIVAGLFLAFLYYAMRISREAVDDLGFFMAFGLVMAVVLQASINIAVVTACIPAKGLPLPFVSFGGSNLVSSMIIVGILLNIADHSRKGPADERS